MNILDKDIFQANVLIVDDQEANVALLTAILTSAGYKNITSTTDSRKAVGLYIEIEADILLLDIRMPHIDGFQVMEELKKRISGDYLPILVLTAEASDKVMGEALSKGAKDFLTKPFLNTEVLHRIRNILEVRLLHQGLRFQKMDLEKIVKQRTQELSQSRYEIIQRLGSAAEYKDNETGNHVLRMSRFCQLLAEAAGLPTSESELILHASPLHDIGKIGIPDQILLKPGSFEEEEWRIMQTHVDIGVELLAGSENPLLIKGGEIALMHHEKWDGSGYPNGLAGEEISIAGRICAICDVFDALTSVRPYKEAWPVEKAMNLIEEQSGKHFDPNLVPLFEAILERIVAYRNEHMD
ncbi:MAG: response regulator [Gammaproteobacteria bacterium]|nr:response regulator [Gammaproteobacteria bacterium]